MTEEGYKRKLTAVFSADVAGYSRLMGEDEAEMVKILTACRKIMEELVQQHRGRMIDSPEDKVLAEFASVVDAVQCAVAAQKELQASQAQAFDSRNNMRFSLTFSHFFSIWWIRESARPKSSLKRRPGKPFSLEEVIMALTKAKLVESVSKNLNLAKNLSSKTVESLFEIMKSELENGNDMLISGFGKFCVKERSRRRWRNPVTNQSMLLAARRIITFRCPSILRDKVNEKR
ncbi:MAG: HU family DNA-binding protein [Deltaproteobacteria bacterium]